MEKEEGSEQNVEKSITKNFFKTTFSDVEKEESSEQNIEMNL